jgi:BirA family transcriptional regulator, biotin operon repressor / biotin---[acetyl-CoA-carboxylase] ligase
MNFEIIKYDTLESTNTEALKQARDGAAEGLCITTREQTAGRGRYGRSWVSGKDAGLFLSVVLRPKIETIYFPLITLMTGVVVHDALAELGVKSDIKWVNDIHVDGKKICGILAETTDTDSGIAVVVGIGVNMNSESFPPYLAASSTSVAEELGRVVVRDDLINTLTRLLGSFYAVLVGENGPAEIVQHWRRRSSYFEGKNVRAVMERETIFGKTVGLEPNGALRVEKSDGSIAIIQAGDVEQLRPVN